VATTYLHGSRLPKINISAVSSRSAPSGCSWVVNAAPLAYVLDNQFADDKRRGIQALAIPLQILCAIQDAHPILCRRRLALEVKPLLTKPTDHKDEESCPGSIEQLCSQRCHRFICQSFYMPGFESVQREIKSSNKASLVAGLVAIVACHGHHGDQDFMSGSPPILAV
jgi:hypothetical protein